MCLVPLWALYSGVTRRMGRALLSSKVLPRACPRRCCLGRAPFGGARSPGFAPHRLGPGPGGSTGLCPHNRSSRPCGRCGKAFGLSRYFGTVGTFLAGALPVAGGRMMRMLGPGGGGRAGRTPGWSGGLGGRALGGCCPAFFSGFLGVWVRLSSSALALVGPEVVGPGGRGVGRRGV